MHMQQLMISQQYIRSIKIESYILASFPNTLTFSGEYHAKKFNIVLNKVKIKSLETHAIAGKMNASYINEVVYTYKGTQKIKSGIKCIALSSTIIIMNCQLVNLILIFLCDVALDDAK